MSNKNIINQSSYGQFLSLLTTGNPADTAAVDQALNLFAENDSSWGSGNLGRMAQNLQTRILDQVIRGNPHTTEHLIPFMCQKWLPRPIRDIDTASFWSAADPGTPALLTESLPFRKAMANALRTRGGLTSFPRK